VGSACGIDMWDWHVGLTCGIGMWRSGIFEK
jgi:hypothetical protein